MDSVNKIQEPKVEGYPVPENFKKVSGEIDDYNVVDLGEINTIHNDKIVMRNNLQTFTGVGRVPADVQDNMNTYEDVMGEDEQGEVGTSDEESREITPSADGIESASDGK